MSSLFGSAINHVIATWGYYAVFGVVALEGFGLFFVPGETTLIAAAVYAAETHHLNIIFVLLAAFCGGILGDNFAFWVGRELGFRLLVRYGHHFGMTKERMKFLQYLFLKYGHGIVFVGRFIMLLRAWESFLAGANAMPWRKFVVVNAVAVLIWDCVWGLGAYGLGQASTNLLEWIGIGIFIVVCAIIVAGWIYFHRHEEDLEAKAEKALPGPLRARPLKPRKAGGEAPA